MLLLHIHVLFTRCTLFGWASSCMNYYINVLWNGDDQLVVLLRFCWGSGSLGCFDIYLQIISLVGSSVSSSSWQYSMNSQKTLGQAVYWSIQHNSTMVIKAGTGIFGNVYRYQILLENEVSISIKLCSRRNHEVPSIEFQHRLLWQRWIW